MAKIVEKVPFSGFCIIRDEETGLICGAVNCYPSCNNSEWTVFDFYTMPNLELAGTKTEIFVDINEEEILIMWERFCSWEI